MLRALRMRPLLLLQALIIAAFCFYSSDASRLPTASADGFHTDGGILWRRSMANASPSLSDYSTTQENKSFILAADRTRRRDPLDGFKYYTGGWNTSNKHYIASVGFTAAPYFVIAAVWFVGFAMVLLLICCCYFCCPDRSYAYSKLAYALSLIILILFTIAAIIGSVFLYYGQEKFHDSNCISLNFVVRKADYVVENLRNFSGSLSTAKSIRVRQYSLPADIQSSIDALQTKVSKSADDLDVQTDDNSKTIRRAFDVVRNVLLFIAAVMLLLAFLGFFFSVLGLQFFVSILVIIGWILVAGTFILSGVFLLYHNVIADSCVAMDEWVQHPSEHTALDDILPCVDVNTANESFNQSKRITYDLTNTINTVITLANQDSGPGFPGYFNQSGPQAPKLCNRYMPDLSNRSCENGELTFEVAPKEWESFVCQASGDPGSQVCTSAGRLTPELYTQLVTATNVSSGLYNYGPFLKDLADCTFARETFSTISRDKCPELRNYSHWVYVGLGIVSGAVMFSMLFWVIYARERRHRKYAKHHSC